MVPPTPSAADRQEVIAIIGVGLIGGSIGAAVKRRHLARTVIGIGRNEARLQGAREAGLIDVASTLLDGIRDADLVIVCTPVDRIAADVLAAAAHLRPGSVITDAGSVKAAICRDIESARLPEGVRFVGSHPLAGSEKAGWEYADADVFQGRVCVVTPEPASENCERVLQFWESLGMQTVVMSPDAHDRAVAITSHLPHVVAAGLASMLLEELIPLAATGFRDTTRIAAGDADLWTSILISNAGPVKDGLSRLMQRLGQIHDALAADDAEAIRRFLASAKANRDVLEGVAKE
jgi:prephenate dehydrogenase